MNDLNTETIQLVKNLYLEIGKLKIDQVMRKLTNTNVIKNKRLEIARLLSSGGKGKKNV